jgi:dTDP-glucose pyrophosphorylase
MSKTTLLALAAGMGSRFGGLKQMTPVADNGAVLLDFSVYDAIASGFDKIIFVIKEEMYHDFKKMIGDKIKNAEVDYVFQEMDSLPEGRVKPWGTGHALLCCRDKIDTPFAIINADDYYGRNAYQDIHKHLCEAKDFDFAMVAFDLKNTITDKGTVARGVCEVENGYLKHITERTKINKDLQYTEDDENWITLPDDTVVSMNLWGFTPKIFDVLEEQFEDFKKNMKNPLKDEFFIPLSVEQLIRDGKAEVKVYNCRDKWYGMTYADDLPAVKEALNQMIQDGYYDGL